MGPFVGIIIAIIWFIYSAINKSKKEQQKRQGNKPVITTADTENKPQTFKDIFDEMKKQGALRGFREMLHLYDNNQ